MCCRRTTSDIRPRQASVSTQQNADKFRACARAPSASATPPAFEIAPVRVWLVVNVHPPCRLVKTPTECVNEPERNQLPRGRLLTVGVLADDGVKLAAAGLD